MLRTSVVLVLAAACGTSGEPGQPVDDPTDPAPNPEQPVDDVPLLPDIVCGTAPDVGEAEGPDHFGSRVVIASGDPNHRGIDLIARAGGSSQILRGEVSYGGAADKALDDEAVDVFACVGGAWKHLGRTRTDDEGAFALTLTGSERLEVGLRDMYLSVAADRSGAWFLALVSEDTRSLAVSDVDGTLTTSENEWFGDLANVPAEIHAGAVDAWKHVRARGMLPVYVTARPRRVTELTRQWLADQGMPRGPLRLSPSVMLPGGSTADYKREALEAMQQELPIALGIGNRGTDLDAYAGIGLPGTRILIKLPEYEDEVAARIAAGEATGFLDYPGPAGAM